MVWSKTKERPKRYLISVGRDKLREKVMEDLWRIVEVEGSSMADEVWDALYMHVERHKNVLEPEDDGGDGRIHMERDIEFDDVVANETYEAQEGVVEEVLDAERRVERRMVRSDSLRNKGGL
tara:strand:- start:149 stop:514 length:366 start_codon:yes stop_codon:yes gene_type:complete